MSNERLALVGIILLVLTVIIAATVAAVFGIIDAQTWQITINTVAGTGVGGLVGYIGKSYLAAKHTKDIEIGNGKILDYSEKSEGV